MRPYIVPRVAVTPRMASPTPTLRTLRADQRYRVHTLGGTLTGTPMEVVREMHARSWFDSDATPDGYLDRVMVRLALLAGSPLTLPPGSLEERAGRFLALMEYVGLAQIGPVLAAV